MRYVLAVLLFLSLGCATTKSHSPFRNPDGSLNLRKIVMYVSYGVEADCALGETTLTAQICTYGREAIDAVNAVSTSDPGLLKASILSILQTAAHDHPQLQPYFEWAFKILQA